MLPLILALVRGWNPKSALIDAIRAGVPVPGSDAEGAGHGLQTWRAGASGEGVVRGIVPLWTLGRPPWRRGEIGDTRVDVELVRR
jgi:hypothetical protein